MAGDKEQLPRHPTSSLVWASTVVVALISALLIGLDARNLFSGGRVDVADYDLDGKCLQESGLSPKNKDVEQFVRSKVESQEYRADVIKKLSGMIQIPSESYDDLGPIGEDSRWDIFFDMEKYIKKTYPDLLKRVKLDHANTHGLILTCQGTDPTAKPILMMAHQDVVPVLPDTVPDWKYPPYQGYYDGEFVWGRGATDDKGYMISVLESLDLLLQSGYKPKRTVILAFGCDEEISGENCGRPIADFLHDRYGDDGIYLIMDEGSMGVQREFDQSFAMVSVAEKGYLDVGINITSTGGHASNPPDHNAIGILSEIVVAIEHNPFTGRVTKKNPMFGFLECAAVHVPDTGSLDAAKKHLGGVAAGDEKAQVDMARALEHLRYYFQTSQSVGKIGGGLKINAIPEAASAMVNLRLDVEASVAQVKEHYESLISPIAEKHGMAFEGFGSAGAAHSDKRKIILYSVDDLEPAPISPVEAEAFKLLSGTIRGTLSPLDGDGDLIVTPYLMAANTDTKFFWRLTKNIYRFTPVNLVQNLNRAHTTDEFIRADEFVREPLFFASLILNADDVL